MRIAIQAENLVGGANFQHAGVGRYSFSIIEHLLRIGDQHEWRLMAPSAFEVPPNWISRPNFRFKAIPEKYRTWRAIGRTPYLLYNRIDVLFVLTGPPCNHRLFKQVATIHDLFPFDYPEGYDADVVGSMQQIVTKQIQRSDHLFAISQNTKERVMARFPHILANKISVTPNGPGNTGESRTYESVATSRLRELGIPYNRYFFTLGTLEPRKNLTGLIQGFGLLCKQGIPPDFGLVIAGGKGWKESAIFEAVTRLGLQDRVTFLGYVADEILPELFARSEAFICASIDEGFGIPVLEGMMYGTPVITSDRGALPEVGGDAVQYFDPANVDRMVQLMRAFVNGTVDREEMIRGGFERAKHFSWEKTAKDCLNVMERLAGRSGS